MRLPGYLPRALIVFGALSLVLAQIPPGLAAPGKISITDDVGRTVSLGQPAQRIVSLAPHVTELLFEVGAGRQIVGAVEYSDYPAAAKELPRIGSANRIDVEKTISLKPDLIVAWHSGNSLQDLQTLSRFGIPVFYSEPRKLTDIAGNMERLGTLAGHEAGAIKKADEFREQLHRLDVEYRNKPRVSVFFQLWHQPLMTINDEHIISDVIRHCGASNVFAELKALTPAVSREAIIERKPQAIVATDISPGDLRKDWGRYTQVPAVRTKNYFVLSADLLHRQGPRLIHGVEQFCRAMDTARSKKQ
jgi:iron complex transport system substrate-binding protein